MYYVEIDDTSEFDCVTSTEEEAMDAVRRIDPAIVFGTFDEVSEGIERWMLLTRRIDDDDERVGIIRHVIDEEAQFDFEYPEPSPEQMRTFMRFFSASTTKNELSVPPQENWTKYSSIIHHPEFGEMLNLTLSAKYLGISRNKFRRVATKPDITLQGIYPYWSKRVLDNLPTAEDPSPQDVFEKGRECGEYLLGVLSLDELRKFRNQVIGTPEVSVTSAVLRERGIEASFRTVREAKWYCQGILTAIRCKALGLTT